MTKAAVWTKAQSLEGSHFYKVNIHFFCIFLDYFSKYFLLKLKLLDKIHTRINIYLEMPQKVGKKNRAGWNKRAGWKFFRATCTFIWLVQVKTSKKYPNKRVQDGIFKKKNKVCCTIIRDTKVGFHFYKNVPSEMNLPLNEILKTSPRETVQMCQKQDLILYFNLSFKMVSE